MANGLRIIGVRILKGCPSHIRKALHEGELYLLYNDFTENKDNQYTLTKIEGKASDTALNLYNQTDASDEHLIHVNVSAVVGKNGDGKSSLVEIVLRVLNNFSCLTGFLSDQKSLRMVENLRAIVYYEIDDDLYAISSEGEHSKIGLWKKGQQVLDIKPEWDDETTKRYLKQYHIDELFYTMVINYSIYAYNSKLIEDENEGETSWIEALFHKNDEYQTPVVLNPMRTDGNININNEEYLSRQRLLSLLTAALPEDDIRYISENQNAIGYSFNLEDESKLIKNSIKRYYNDCKNTHYSLGNFAEMHQHPHRITDLTERGGIKSRLDNFMDFCKDFRDLYAKHLSFFAIVIESIEKEEKPETTDLNTLALYMADFKKWGYCNDENGDIQFFIDLFTSDDDKKLNYAFLYRLFVILKIWDVLKTDESTCFKHTIDEAMVSRQEPKCAAELYCCYKILSILTTYKPFIEHSHVYDSSINLLLNIIDNNIELRELGEDVKKVLSIDDYRTLKLRQTLNYLKYINQYPDDKYYTAEESVKTIYENDENAEDYGRPKDIKQYFVTFDKLNANIKKFKGKVLSREVVLYLPPPIFIGDIIIENEEGDRFPYSSLSSGQLQKWNTVGALMYHLRNLNDEPEGDDIIHYKHINVIFEEVELYFHPEFQREFVSYVLEMIHRSTLPNIESINICFVTHSPFILSDILRNNTLYLENGYRVTKFKEETFGANLYDLMVSSFFIEDNAMGCYASKFIGNLIKKFNDGEELSNDEKAMVGDIIIRNYISSKRIKQ